MTAQVPDDLLFNDRKYWLASEPLAPWLSRKKNKHIRFLRKNSARSRGYGAKWSISQGRLYLSEFRALLPDGASASMDSLFENYSEQFYASVKACAPENRGPGRFAFWYTGTLVCPLGKLVEYKHSGFGGTYERELWLSVTGGYLIGSRVVDNANLQQVEFDACYSY